MQGPGPAQGGIALPPLTRGLKVLLIALFGLYVLQLICENYLGIPVSLLAWAPGTPGPWQPFTRFIYQMADPPGFLLMLLAFYFFVPPTLEQNPRRELIEIAAAVFLGSTLLALGMDQFFPKSATAGWGSVLIAMLALFGLRAPGSTILLAFVIPIEARIFVALSGGIAGLTLLFAPGLQGGDYLGAFLGVLLWWYGRGPGKRRRELASQGRQVERELRRFTVLQGGQSDDDLVH
ncbi:MAG: hypothetical protein KC912_01940 [Proteobacteria bacterium]|nr:hypothetical protein [Pseudomonadota bacterium]